MVGNPTTKLKIGEKVFLPLLQLYNSFRTSDIQQKKISKSLSVFKLCLKMIFNNTETALEIQVPFSSSISVLTWCFNIEQTT